MSKEKIYSEETVKIILDKFHKKGWNLYKHEISENHTIRNNLVQTSLEINTHYTLLPFAKDPKDPDQVFESLEKLAISLNRKIPTIQIEDDSHELLGITLKEHEVKLHNPEGTHVSYQQFIDAIDNYISTLDN